MIGGSLLVIYEADLERAKGSLASMASGFALSEEGLENDDDDDDDVDVEDDEEEEEASRLPYVVKLIDFAHTKLVLGQGPDEGVLLGIDTTLKLLDGRIAQISVDDHV
jgi:1D-myo-inositol-tetrakisphosphate 5-kinase/inositol-polyphosphate multikinase